jgi:hypothetical protein
MKFIVNFHSLFASIITKKLDRSIDVYRPIDVQLGKRLPRPRNRSEIVIVLELELALGPLFCRGDEPLLVPSADYTTNWKALLPALITNR